MEGNYCVNIYDLSQEIKELNALTSQVETIRQNYISDIILYLNRQFEEISKIINEFFMIKYFSIDSYVSIRFYKYKDNSIYLSIALKSNEISKEKSFNISNPNDPEYLNDIQKYPNLADFLIEHWKEVKDNLSIKINEKLFNIKKENKEKLSKLQKRLAIYENFKI